ncbi:MAG: DUF2798 domain-containing protein [Bacilli bacterium]|nr:DUF2798 domain-containing protein [Bacilli bacterium]
MPKNKKEEIIFSIIMVTFMVWVMVFYNISLEKGLGYPVFLMTLQGFLLPLIFAWLVEHFIVGKWVKRITFSLWNPAQVQPIVIVLTMSVLTVTFMCPIMSLLASFAYHINDLKNLPFIFLKTFVFNFPMALFVQLFYVGPLVRYLFKKLPCIR